MGEGREGVCYIAVHVETETLYLYCLYFALLMRWGDPECCSAVYVGSETTVSAGPLLSFVDEVGDPECCSAV